MLDGICRVAGEEVRILYSQGSDLVKNRAEELAQPGDRLAEAKTVAGHSDVVILCLGFDETLEGEEGDTGNRYASGDKTDLSLPKAQQKLMEAIRETGKPPVRRALICATTHRAPPAVFDIYARILPISMCKQFTIVWIRCINYFLLRSDLTVKLLLQYLLHYLDLQPERIVTAYGSYGAISQMEAHDL